jgi:hypothetical protein
MILSGLEICSKIGKVGQRLNQTGFLSRLVNIAFLLSFNWPSFTDTY